MGGDDGLVAGVDVATAAVRVVVADGRGRVEAEADAELPEPVCPRPGWWEQDPTGWWPAVVRALGEATGQLGRRRGDVAAVAVSATSGTVVLAGEDGEPVGPALLHRDQRAAADADRAQAADEDRWTALGLRIGAGFGLPKWAWLLREAGGAGKARFAWHASDVVVARLTGEPPVTDWSHALKSGYDPARREWAAGALEALGIPLGMVPDVRAPAAGAGRVGAEAAAATGLPEGCAVRLGMTDGCAAQLAAGAGAPGRFVGVLGTTLVLKGTSTDLVRDPTGAVYSHRHPDGWWLPGGASNTGTAALDEGFGSADLARLDREAAARGPASVVTYPLTGDGERFPFLAPGARPFWLGHPADDVERYRATLEGVAFVERLALAHLARLGAPADPPLAVAGGGSRSPAWNRLRATVLGHPVVRAAVPTTAFGACLLAAAGTLHDGLPAAAAAMVTEAETAEPVAAERHALDAGYRRFVAALVERGWVDEGLASEPERPG